jgi:hypothetical protein
MTRAAPQLNIFFCGFPSDHVSWFHYYNANFAWNFTAI